MALKHSMMATGRSDEYDKGEHLALKVEDHLRGKIVETNMRLDMKKRSIYFKKEMAASSDQQLSKLDISRGIGLNKGPGI